MPDSAQVHPGTFSRWFTPWSDRTIRAVLLVGLGARVLLALILPPGYDEAYYQFYGLNLAPSYFDHPLAVGIWSWLGLHLGGSLLAYRLPCLLSYTVALTWMGSATEIWFGRRASTVAVVLGSLSPLLLACGGLLLLPDSPLLLAIAALLRWLADRPRLLPATPRESLVLGSLLGVMTLGKYHALLLLLGLLVWSLCRSGSRELWRRPWPWLGIVVWALVSSPLWIWNHANHWVSFLFQGARTTASTGFHPDGSLLFLLTQALLVFPTVAVVLALGLAPRARPDRSTPHRQLLRWLAVPQLVVFLVLAGRMQVLASWLVPCWFLLLPLAGDWWSLHASRAWQERKRHMTRLTGLVLTPLLVVVALQVRWGIADSLLPRGVDTSSELLAPDALRQALTSDPVLWQALQGAPVIASLHYEQTGFLALALDPGIRSRLTTFSPDPRGFAFWQPATGFKGSRGLIYRVRPLPDARGITPEPQAWPEGIGALKPIAQVTVLRGGRPAMLLEFQEFGPLHSPWPRPYGPGAG